MLSLLLIFLATGTLQAQDADRPQNDTVPEIVVDSLMVGDLDTTRTETRRERRQRERAEAEEAELEQVVFKDSARLAIEALTEKAWKRSLMIPGWGQYTNGGLWWIKVPVIYGGFVTTALVFEFNNRYYREILGEVQYRLANNHAEPPNTQYPNVAKDSQGTQRMIVAKDYYRRNRDLMVLLTVAWWGINSIEAYVNSILKYRWDIGDDLGFNVAPTLLPQPTPSFAYQPYAFGVKVSIQLGKQ